MIDGTQAAQEALEEQGRTDGLPVVPPTAERVAAMLAACGVDPAEVVTVLPPCFAQATWRDIAVNAVMAGCRDAYLPVVGAALEAISAPEFNLIGVATTTGSASTLVIVNGPVAGALGMNAGSNALGPGNRANATIGRALRLCLQNIGGATPGEVDMATLGQPGKYTFCLAENEAESPWPPLHVERGHAAEDSVVTVVAPSGIVEIVDSASRSAADLARTIAQSMLIAGNIGGAGLIGGGEPLLILPPELARLFAADGHDKARVKAAIWERAALPLAQLSPAVQAHLRERAVVEDRGDGGVLRVAERPDDVMIVVAGGVGVKAAYVPTWGGGTRSVTRPVRGA